MKRRELFSMQDGKALLMTKNLAMVPAPETKPYFTIKEVAALLGKSYPTVQRRVMLLNIPLFTRGTNSRTKYIAFADIDRIRDVGEEFHPWKVAQ